jgi:cytochrome b6-f complex iron-sulfur subunit
MAEQTSPSRNIDRRQFILITWAASLAALASQTGIALLKFFEPRVQTGGFGGRLIAGLVEEFPPGSVQHVPAGQFYISHIEDVGLMALWHRCTHLGCTVPWQEEENQFTCPCHSSFFDPNGEVTGGPAPRPLDLFPIEIIDGEVIVDTGRTIERQQFDPSQATKV